MGKVGAKNTVFCACLVHDLSPAFQCPNWRMPAIHGHYASYLIECDFGLLSVIKLEVIQASFCLGNL